MNIIHFKIIIIRHYYRIGVGDMTKNIIRFPLACITIYVNSVSTLFYWQNYNYVYLILNNLEEFQGQMPKFDSSHDT